jgi:lipopolysaccharide biosynthesis glycosyltransferase
VTGHIAVAARGRYVRHSATLLGSLGAQAAGVDLQIHYLHAGLSRRVRRHLERAAGEPIAFHDVPEQRVAGLPVHGYFTSAMWYRLLLDELVDADRVLYLDVDTLAIGALAPLLATDLSGAYLAAVTNVFQPDHLFHAADLGIAAERYFNSGVLLLHLAAIREDGCMDRVRQVAAERADLRGWPDQDALNLVLGERRVALHPRWNAMNALWRPEAEQVFGAAATAEARQAPAIRHFEGPADNKPWARASRPPGAELWRAQRRQIRPWF